MKTIRLGLIFIFVLILSGCNNTGNRKTTEKETIKFGAILPLTGKYADIGNWEKVGLQIAAEELSLSDSNYNFDIIIEDAKSEAKDAISAYNKLVNIDKVRIILTTPSALSLAIKPNALKDSILFFSIASHPEITKENNGMIFRPCATSVEESNAISNYIKSNFEDGKNKTCILYHNSEFGISFKDQIYNNIPNSIINMTPYEDTPESFKNLIFKVLQSKPDIISIIGFTPSLGILCKTIRELNFSGTIIANTGFYSPSVLETAGNSAIGVKYVEYNFPVNSEHFIKIDSISQEKYKTNFGSMSFLAYFTIKALNHAALECNSSEISKIASFLRTPQAIKIDGIELNTFESGNIFPQLVIKNYDNN